MLQLTRLMLQMAYSQHALKLLKYLFQTHKIVAEAPCITGSPFAPRYRSPPLASSEEVFGSSSCNTCPTLKHGSLWYLSPC
ncbi:hypothetical protein CEXT_225531 [Caerostris extrusa]|uniref:Uncharacterized protein n=1 Tax=Caerostris extrusa TaxID=172846 RepID=A0AAV4PLG2_CAEEX|nr:hypothetical protein CEXT_225531 [Caerostris extrusa]